MERFQVVKDMGMCDALPCTLYRCHSSMIRCVYGAIVNVKWLVFKRKMYEKNSPVICGFMLSLLPKHTSGRSFMMTIANVQRSRKSSLNFSIFRKRISIKTKWMENWKRFEWKKTIEYTTIAWRKQSTCSWEICEKKVMNSRYSNVWKISQKEKKSPWILVFVVAQTDFC